MRSFWCLAAVWYVVVTAPDLGAASPSVVQHVLVYGEEGKFAGWPANHGMWMWGNEILVGFSTGMHKDLGDRHNIDREQPEHHVLARSRDGGRSWQMEFPAERGMLINAGGMRHGTTDPRHKESKPVAIEDPIRFTDPNFCMTLRFSDVDGGASRLYYSYDRGHIWAGPFAVPDFSQLGVMARTDYLVNSEQNCHVFLTASKSNREEGRVFCGQTNDGGRSWEFLSYVGPEPTGFAIMPSTVRISPEVLVMARRCREGEGEAKHRWIDVWRSPDNGRTWESLGDAVDDLGEGNPPAMIRLQDGRLCLTYGVRKPPYEMQARFSSDEGRTWSSPFVIKTGGGGRDIGYPRTLQRPDGKVVTVYYFQPAETPYRQILATIWEPGAM